MGLEVQVHPEHSLGIFDRQQDRCDVGLDGRVRASFRSSRAQVYAKQIIVLPSPKTASQRQWVERRTTAKGDEEAALGA